VGKSDSNDFRFDRPDGQYIHLKSSRVNQIVFVAARKSAGPVRGPRLEMAQSY